VCSPNINIQANNCKTVLYILYILYIDTEENTLYELENLPLHVGLRI